jgi:hypothetical protein
MSLDQQNSKEGNKITIMQGLGAWGQAASSAVDEIPVTSKQQVEVGARTVYPPFACLTIEGSRWNRE